MSAKQSPYEAITAELIKLLDSGAVPWRMPWRVTGEGPTNISTGKPYTGGNAMWLYVLGHAKSYRTSLWGTYRQIKAKGGQVRKGEKSTPCVWYSAVPVKKDGGAVLRDGEQVYRKVAKGFRVFNLDQADGLDHMRPAEQPATMVDCQTIVAGMPNRPRLSHGGDRAFYRPSDDSVRMPPLAQFDDESHYWGVLFHELGHSTGHPSRLGRFQTGKAVHADAESYSAEELVAEFCSAYLCGVSGIERDTMHQSASYIDSWRKALAGQPHAMGVAISKAMQAADYVLNNQRG